MSLNFLSSFSSPACRSENGVNRIRLVARMTSKVDTKTEGNLSAYTASSEPASFIDKRNQDSAFKFIQNASNGDIDTSSVDLGALRRRIDLRILPAMFLCSMAQFLDKADLNYAAIMGLRKDLSLTGNNFSDVATFFGVAYLIFEVPSGYIVQKVPAGKWLSICLIAWGITTACTAAATNYTNLVVARVFLGIFEAAITPCQMLITSQWYTIREQAPRFAFWFCGVAFAQILGSLLSFAFQYIGPGAALSGWKTMFIVLGILTMLVAAVVVWIVPDTPMSAKWMSDVEKMALLNHLGENRTGIENRRFKPSQVLELLLDVQMWLIAMIIILNSMATGVIAIYSATILHNFGYSPKNSALLNMPSGLVSIIANVIVGYGVPNITHGHRWLWLVACCTCGMSAGALLAFAPASNHAALLAGFYLVTAYTPSGVLLYQWTMANVAGHTKRACASAVVAGAVAVGGLIAPQTFQAKDAPQYHRAKISLLATQAGAACLTVVLFAYYVLSNRRKEQRQKKLVSEGAVINKSEDTWGNLTDKENVEFRYAY